MPRRPKGNPLSPQRRLLEAGRDPAKVMFRPHTHTQKEVRGLVPAMAQKANLADAPTFLPLIALATPEAF